MTIRSLFGACSILALAVGMTLGSSPAGAQAVGAAAAVKPSSTGTPPGGTTRTLEVGTDIVSRERIRTTGTGSLQVMFLDKSTMTIGPNSDLLIDEFVYSGNANTGTFSARLASGALRFVGGQISHNSGATVTTPVATIGIRGGAAFITHNPNACSSGKGVPGANGCTTVVCTGGRCTVNSLVDSRTFQLRISQAVEVSGLGGAQFDVRSVTLGDVAKGGDGNIALGGTGNKDSATFTAQDLWNKINPQTPEPPPPPPPP